MVPNVLAEHQAPPLQMFYYWQWLMTTISILLRCATVLRIINYLTYIQCSAFAAEATPLCHARGGLSQSLNALLLLATDALLVAWLLRFCCLCETGWVTAWQSLCTPTNHNRCYVLAFVTNARVASPPAAVGGGGGRGWRSEQRTVLNSDAQATNDKKKQVRVLSFIAGEEVNKENQHKWDILQRWNWINILKRHLIKQKWEGGKVYRGELLNNFWQFFLFFCKNCFKFWQ